MVGWILGRKIKERTMGREKNLLKYLVGWICGWKWVEFRCFFFSYPSKYFLPQRTRKTDKKAQCQPKTKFAPPSSLCLCFVSYVHVVLFVFLILSLSCLFNRCFCPFFFLTVRFFYILTFFYSYFISIFLLRHLSNQPDPKKSVP